MHFILSWGSGICLILLCIIAPLRITIKKMNLPKEHMISKTNKFLRYIHKLLGVVTIIMVFLHCRVAFRITNIRSVAGVGLLLLLIIISLTYPLRKLFGDKWMKIHQFLTIILAVVATYHMFFEFMK